MAIDVTKKIETHIAFIFPYQFPFYDKRGYVISYDAPTAFGTFRAVKTTVVDVTAISSGSSLQQKNLTP
jgi:hypothetical protein